MGTSTRMIKLHYGTLVEGAHGRSWPASTRPSRLSGNRAEAANIQA
jgi:hypothetical protein